MDSDERAIFDFLHTWGATFVGAKEICRRAANKKRFHEDAEWAKPVLLRLTDRGLLESDAAGKYRIKPLPKSAHHGQPPDTSELAEIHSEYGTVEADADGPSESL